MNLLHAPRHPHIGRHVKRFARRIARRVEARAAACAHLPRGGSRAFRSRGVAWWSRYSQVGSIAARMCYEAG